MPSSSGAVRSATSAAFVSSGVVASACLTSGDEAQAHAAMSAQPTETRAKRFIMPSGLSLLIHLLVVAGAVPAR